jgi:lipopolysaccharide transport system ATP-binding protein
MSDPVIRVENLGKRYKLGLVHHDRLADAMTAAIHWAAGGIRRLFSHNGRAAPNSETALPAVTRHGSGIKDSDEIWALRNVSFEVERGEVLGIIGRNGSGKSTLLKILTGITEPTEGRARIKGRVASLLEVGTGFHPELTGRENIYLNGAILGMSRVETRSKFDEIVAFADIDKFIDTPVKRYSSGMYVRLAFAVAAHLEPEILLVDEVLAVGDMHFQRKCLGRMETVSKEGRTVLFVSHNMAAIEGLCSKAALLENGQIGFWGGQMDAIRRYVDSMAGEGSMGQSQSHEMGPCVANGRARILDASVTSCDWQSAGKFPIGARLEFHINCAAYGPIKNPVLGIGIDTELGQRVVTFLSTLDPSTRVPEIGCGDVNFLCQPVDLALAPGRYRVTVRLNSGHEELHVLEDAFSFMVLPGDFYKAAGRVGRGVILCKQIWQIK